ncbi:hypothetical protein [Streptomyces sp. PSKA30]|uniref:hypothetical protein n=1 Tax=Streptomyces sp. PSKA30 TaxID=2874597 RepID=UPI001CD0CDA7|nr:hypothetical protein [Streptomyces sp. PSKA30]MBZ9642541.1 hypothetical protein [Streptomyces sp. PSKA30]
MLLYQTLRGLLGLGGGLFAQETVGAVGLGLLFLIGVGIRARHSGLAVGGAVALALLMTQA